MDTTTPPLTRDRLDLAAVARLLVLLQAAVLLSAIVEAALFVGLIGPAVLPGMAITAGALLLTLLSVAGLARGSRWARRWTLVAEIGVVSLVLPDLLVGLLLGTVELTLLGVVLRLGVPIAVIALLRRPEVRARIGPVPAARQTAARPPDARRLTATPSGGAA